jgi:hypothetical protein
VFSLDLSDVVLASYFSLVSASVSLVRYPAKRFSTAARQFSFSFAAAHFPSRVFSSQLKTLFFPSELGDGNKSLYLVFVGVVFLSTLDCF